MRRRSPVLTALFVGLLAVGACSHDGRSLAPTRPDQTTTTTGLPAIGATGDPIDTFALVTDVVEDGGELPVRFTCFGERLSPPLRWSNVPLGTVQLAIVVRDRDADGYVHWLVTRIDPAITGFGEGGVPEGAVEQVNQTGAIGWDAPCPPTDGGRHIYDIAIYALDQQIDIDPADPASAAATAVETASTAKAALALTVTPPAAGVGSTEP